MAGSKSGFFHANRARCDFFGLVHAAGAPVPGGLFEVTPEAWQGAFDVHVHAVFHLARAAVPHMRRNKMGALVLISSTAGKLGVPGSLAYQAAKGALPHLTRALSRELAPDNIRINCVAPGVIRTRFHEKMSPATVFFRKGIFEELGKRERVAVLDWGLAGPKPRRLGGTWRWRFALGFIGLWPRR